MLIQLFFFDLPYENDTRHSGLSSSISRYEKEATRLEDRCKTVLNLGKLENLNDLIAKITEELPRQKYLLHQAENGAYLSKETPLSILIAIYINSDLEVAISPFSTYKHIIPSIKVTLLSQVLNLIAFTKNKDQKKQMVEEQFQS